MCVLAGLMSLQETHTGAVHEEMEPEKGAYTGELHGGLHPVRGAHDSNW